MSPITSIDHLRLDRHRFPYRREAIDGGNYRRPPAQPCSSRRAHIKVPDKRSLPFMTTSEPASIVAACLLVIGDEILSGRTQDANIAFLAKALNEVGVRLREVRVIPDAADTIVDTVNAVRARYDYVFTTGGIGPTHDDITSECVARAFGVPLVLNAEAKSRLESRAKFLPLNEARLRMAHVPEGATLIDNPLSAAPGFQIGNVFVMAGVPAVAKAMFESLRPRLSGGARVESVNVTCDLAEGTLAADLGVIQERWPTIAIGSYPLWNPKGFAVNLVLRGTERAELDAALAEVIDMIQRLGGVVLDDEARSPKAYD
jgi:molybdenum cofactor synthesis domain-containing protein